MQYYQKGEENKDHHPTALRYISSALFLASCSFSNRFRQFSSLRDNVSMQLERENSIPLAVAYDKERKLFPISHEDKINLVP